MSEIVREGDAELAFQAEQRIKFIVREMQKGWIALAGELHAFHAGRMWTKLGYTTFDEWLATPDVEIKRRHVYNLIEMWRVMVVEGNLQPEALEGVPVTRLRTILPAVRRGLIEPEDAVSEALVLTRGDLEERYSTPELDRRLEATEEPEFMLCPTCGARQRVMPS